MVRGVSNGRRIRLHAPEVLNTIVKNSKKDESYSRSMGTQVAEHALIVYDSSLRSSETTKETSSLPNDPQRTNSNYHLNWRK